MIRAKLLSVLLLAVSSVSVTTVLGQSQGSVTLASAFLEEQREREEAENGHDEF